MEKTSNNAKRKKTQTTVETDHLRGKIAQKKTGGWRYIDGGFKKKKNGGVPGAEQGAVVGGTLHSVHRNTEVWSTSPGERFPSREGECGKRCGIMREPLLFAGKSKCGLRPSTGDTAFQRYKIRKGINTRRLPRPKSGWNLVESNGKGGR